jgi:hypothetical protein
LHMPSHVFTRVGAWEDSIATNRRSAQIAVTGNEADEAYHCRGLCGVRAAAARARRRGPARDRHRDEGAGDQRPVRRLLRDRGDARALCDGARRVARCDGARGEAVEVSVRRRADPLRARDRRGARQRRRRGAAGRRGAGRACTSSCRTPGTPIGRTRSRSSGSRSPAGSRSRRTTATKR